MGDEYLMRCSCHVCDTYMTHSESMELGCVCPECGYRCKACLGTNTVLSRDALKSLANNPAFLSNLFQEPEEEKEAPLPPTRKEDYID